MKLTKNQKLAAEKIEARQVLCSFRGSVPRQGSFFRLSSTRPSRSTSVLGIDTRQADPAAPWHGLLCRTVPARKFAFAVFAEGAAARPPRRARRDRRFRRPGCGNQAGSINFDATVATPDMMGKVGRLVRFSALAVLCRTPSSSTVTPRCHQGYPTSSRAARSSIDADRYGITHVIIGKGQLRS